MGRVAVVTGAASGMGFAIARHFATRGDRVALLDLAGEAAHRAAEALRDARRLLQLLYSGILVSFAVEIWRQPYVPDAGTASFELKIAPVL